MMLVKLVGSIGLLVYGMKRYRDIDNGGYILYGNAFSFGMLTSVFSTILYVAYFLVMIVTNAATIRDQLYVTFQELTDKGLVQEEALSSFSFIVENVEWIIPLIVFVWSMLLGLIYSLIISAAIVRKKPIFEE